jgi:hypothetical protein
MKRTGVDLSNEVEITSDGATRGKTIRALIQELLSFEDQDLNVHMSVDEGNTRKPISLVKIQREGVS